MSLLVLVLLILLLAGAFGGWGYPRYGWPAASPLGLILLVVLILLLLGRF